MAILWLYERRPRDDFFVFLPPGWIDCAEKLQFLASRVLYVLDSIGPYVYGVSFVHFLRFLVDVHDSLSLQKVVHLAGLKSMWQRDITGAEFGMGKAVPQIDGVILPMKDLSQYRLVGRNRFPAVLQLLDEHGLIGYEIKNRVN